MTTSTLHQIYVIGRRSARKTLRQPAAIIPPVLFPLMLFALNSSGLSRAAQIPGFPADSYIDFAIVTTFVQGGLFAATTAGTGLAEDIEQGFLDRLALTPMSGSALVLGQLAGGVSVSVLASIVYLAVGLLAGIHVASGVAGALLLLVLATFTALTFSCIGALLALRTGSTEAVQGLFPLLFVSFFLSSLNLPRELIQVDWFRWVATVNPVSYLIEGLRSLVITGWDVQALLIDVGVITVIVCVTLAMCTRALRQHMVRT